MSVGNLIDGRAISAQILGELAARVAALKKRGVQPGLAFVRVGEDPASKVYVGRKEKASAELGIFSETRVLPEKTSEADLLTLIAMALPMALLYEACIWVAWMMERRQARSTTT